MAFKDAVSRDRATFIDFDFFGERRHIDGNEIVIVVDDDALKERQSGQEYAVAESSLLFYAKVEDLPARRAAGSGMNIDGRIYIIDDWAEDMGVATVTLHENRPG